MKLNRRFSNQDAWQHHHAQGLDQGASVIVHRRKTEIPHDGERGTEGVGIVIGLGHVGNIGRLATDPNIRHSRLPMYPSKSWRA